VSKGCEARQNKKIEQLDIRHYFWRIELCKTGADKKKAFVKLMEEACLLQTPKRVMVVGNRLDEEIKYGNILGCQTVHLIHGKYADRVPTHLHENPTYQIHEIGELALLVTAHTS
jgi:FMN phosphatase YigB (HAD superfamily)